MNANGWFQIVLYVALLLACAKPLGLYMARVYEGRSPLARVLDPVENCLYRLAGVDAANEMSSRQYAGAFLLFNLLGLLVVYGLQRLQGMLPLDPEGFAGVSADSSFNTAISFASNTNWQGYGGETTMSYLTQMLALTPQNFVSAAGGMAVLVALTRGFARREATTLGNFWIDLSRSVLHILLPLSLLLAVALVGQGVVQTFSPYATASLDEPVTVQQPVLDATNQPRVAADGPPVVRNETITTQRIAVGPAASQIAIKQLGTNGGGFFNVNSAHPFENPTPLSNILEMLAILLIPAALCVTFGDMVRDRRQGWALLATMTILFVALLVPTVLAESAGNPALTALGVDGNAGNLEGKEVRFGIANSALWATATTAASNGSVNAMHDSFTPLGGMAPLWLMQLGEIVFGGVGSGLYGMIVFAIVAVFVAGLMIGRTPEYLGKKIEAFEVKMAAVVVLVPALFVLAGTALAVSVDAGRAGILNPGAHGFSEVLYALSSASNNNGSAFAGLSANTPFYNTLLGLAMLFGRYWLAVAVLAIAGALAAKRTVPAGPGTLPTHTPLFIALLIGTVVIVGALTFVPALALGPVAEHLAMVAH
ncbi:MAG: potassium-transporting ATPase subunit KdpA [Burkholderiales bacterium]|nr:potassium-transporting ATPase subunit KdpA [Burkholderiales bacterium]